MRRHAATLAFLAVLGVGRVASAEEALPTSDPRPSSGVDLLGGGIALTAIGALSFATAPICNSSVVIPQEQSPCFSVSFIIGTPALVAGVSLVVIGAVQRAHYNAWLKRHPALRGLEFGSTSRGGLLGYDVSF
jgi:hypothetical protein